MAAARIKARFIREFHWTRPDGSLGFGAKPLPEPQLFPRDFIAAAIAAGAAVGHPSAPSDAASGAANLKE